MRTLSTLRLAFAAGTATIALSSAALAQESQALTPDGEIIVTGLKGSLFPG